VNDISAQTPIGRIAADHPLTTRVFARHRLDYCCGGDRPLEDACEAKGLDADEVMREIEREIEATRAPGGVATRAPGGVATRRWDDATAREIIEHIVAAYHEPLREELPRLVAMARKVAAVHGDLRPDTLPALATTVASLKTDLERHMAEEERDVFPRIVGEERAGATDRFAGLEHDHEEAGAALERIRELTGDYEVPAEACGTWRALWHGLEDLERTMHEHVHLENNVLFPKARSG